MFSPSLALAAALSLVAAPGIVPGTQLTYSGTMSGVKDDGNPAVKQFKLTLVAIAGEPDAVDFAWTLDESGRGSWTWLDRFGKWTVMPARNASEAAADSPGPALLYARAEGKSIVPPLGHCLSAPKQLESGATWSDDRLEHRVTGEGTKLGRTCWEIDVRSPYGHKRRSGLTRPSRWSSP